MTGLVAMRFTVDTLGILAVLGGVLAAGLAVLAYSLTAWGYRRAHASLHKEGSLHHGGWAQLFAASAVLAIGILCAAFLLIER